MALTPAERQRAYRERRQAAVTAMPKIPCACGCGKPIAPLTKQGMPARFAHGHNPTPSIFVPGHQLGHLGVEARRRLDVLSGPGHPNWRGGEWRVGGGYVRCTISKAQADIWPTARRHGNGWSIQRSHKAWNTVHQGDVVQPGEQVHHRNGVRDDDSLGNLEKLERGAHLRMHNRERRVRRDSATGRFTSA